MIGTGESNRDLGEGGGHYRRHDSDRIESVDSWGGREFGSPYGKEGGEKKWRRGLK